MTHSALKLCCKRVEGDVHPNLCCMFLLTGFLVPFFTVRVLGGCSASSAAQVSFPRGSDAETRGAVGGALPKRLPEPGTTKMATRGAAGRAFRGRCRKVLIVTTSVGPSSSQCKGDGAEDGSGIDVGRFYKVGLGHTQSFFPCPNKEQTTERLPRFKHYKIIQQVVYIPVNCLGEPIAPIYVGSSANDEAEGMLRLKITGPHHDTARREHVKHHDVENPVHCV